MTATGNPSTVLRTGLALLAFHWGAEVILKL